tara:strand:+ start:2330 stop:3232 length:903 start_codon:yes stop_codon:yes gene_type:complete
MDISNKKKFDIIIPCFNVDNIIEKSLDSIFSQKYSNDKFSVIAIDDGSTDNTLKSLNNYKSEKNFTLINFKSNKGLSKARNEGIRSGNSEIICFIDSDMVIQPNWLLNVEKILMKKGVIGTIGKTVLPKGQTPNKLDNYFYSKYRGVRQFGSDSIIGPTWFLFNNSAVKRSAIEKTNLFDENIRQYGGEDTDLAIRLWDRFPKSFYYSSQIIAEHHHKRTLEQFCSQLEIYGKHNLPMLLKKHPKYYKALGGDWTNSIKGWLVFNMVIAGIIKIINNIISNNLLTKYLVVYSAIRGYRSA